MATVRSHDGTEIAFSTEGSGPAVIIVDGALCYREMGPSKALSKVLAEHYTVFSYDRRGRGESGDTKPYAVAREVEDISALIDVAGGPVSLIGISSGVALALDAAAAGLAVDKLALYEAPLVVNSSPPSLDATYRRDLDAALAEGRRADAVRLFMRLVGAPGPMVALMRFMPAWPKLKRVAHTLPYDEEILRDARSGGPLPRERWAPVTAPTLSMAGAKSPDMMKTAMQAIAETLPSARYEELAGQTHMVKAKVVGPKVHEFLASS